MPRQRTAFPLHAIWTQRQRHIKAFVTRITNEHDEEIYVLEIYNIKTGKCIIKDQFKDFFEAKRWTFIYFNGQICEHLYGLDNIYEFCGSKEV